MNKKIKIIIICVVSLISLLCLGLMFISQKNHKIWLSNYEYFYKDKVKYIGSENIIDSPHGIKYTFSINIRNDNHGSNTLWNSNDDLLKTIFNGHGSPNILYDRKNNNVIIQLAYRNNKNIISYYNIDCDYFENQKWVNLVITLNNNKANVFKNGKLYKSVLLDNIHIKSYKRPQIGDKLLNFNGYVGNIDYYNYILNQKQIKKLFNKNTKKLPNKLKTYYIYEKEIDKKEKIKSKFQQNIFRLV